MILTLADLYLIFLQSTGVTTHSGNCAEGMLFFALKGEKHDGNQFVQEVLSKGAIGAVVDDVNLQEFPKCYYFPNALQALQELAAYHRTQLNIPFIGITGTNGKTTTKELMAAVLSKKYSVAFTQGNLNNHIGVPLTLLSVDPKQHELAIVEMGANHIGEIAVLTQIAKPNFGLITNIGIAHLQGFGSFEGVKQAKGELYEYIREHQGKVFVNGADALLVEMSKGIPTVEYIAGSHPRVLGAVNSCSRCLDFQWTDTTTLNVYDVHSKMEGDYNFTNAMAALAVGLYFDIHPDLINEALADYIPSNNRSQHKDTGRNKLVIDAYNANPSSMYASVASFLKTDHGVLILGDMMELGDYEHKEHMKLLQFIAGKKCKAAYVIGNAFYSCRSEIDQPFIHFFNTKEEFQMHLLHHPLLNEEILIKGSRSMKMEAFVDEL